MAFLNFCTKETTALLKYFLLPSSFINIRKYDNLQGSQGCYYYRPQKLNQQTDEQPFSWSPLFYLSLSSFKYKLEVSHLSLKWIQMLHKILQGIML